MQVGFFKNSLNSQKKQLYQSLFYNKISSELWQNFMSIFSFRTVTVDCL